mgnify:CR=1 FL=1
MELRGSCQDYGWYVERTVEMIFIHYNIALQSKDILWRCTTVVRGKPKLQLNVVDKMTGLGNIASACKYVKEYYTAPTKPSENILDKLNDFVSSYRDRTNIDVEKRFSDAEKKENDDWESELSEAEVGINSEDFYNLNFSQELIILVDTVESLQDLTRELFSPAKIIGFDAEWKQVVCIAGEQDSVSILQLAVPDKVFILDLFKLYVIECSEDILPWYGDALKRTREILQ